jgi:hypothetical protein
LTDATYDATADANSIPFVFAAKGVGTFYF